MREKSRRAVCSGQETNTTARGNAVGCPRTLECRCKGCVAEHRDSDFLEQTGIYTLTGECGKILWRSAARGEGGQLAVGDRRRAFYVASRALLMVHLC